MTPIHPVNAVALPAHGHWWVILYDDAHTSQAIQQCGRWASRHDVAFSWYDAARLAHEIREQARQRTDTRTTRS